jgi:hypothetical protein
MLFRACVGSWWLHGAFHHCSVPEPRDVLRLFGPRLDRVYQPLHRLIADGAVSAL